jgi:uncharacterized protein YcbK (DUF882 family)
MNWEQFKYFNQFEFACRCGTCGSDGDEMHEVFMAKLNHIRELCDFPFIITSGYRCPAYNNRVGSTGFDGPHTTGRAADILMNGEQAHKLLMMIGYRMTGIGISQRGPHEKRFIHLDDLIRPHHPRPWIWSY